MGAGLYRTMHIQDDATKHTIQKAKRTNLFGGACAHCKENAAKIADLGPWLWFRLLAADVVMLVANQGLTGPVFEVRGHQWELASQ